MKSSATGLIFILLSFAGVLSSSACIKRQRETNVPIASQSRDGATGFNNLSRININTASVAELVALPGIGKSLAARIIEYRQKYGPFRRVEHLIIVRGISDKRYRALRELVTVE